MGKALGVGVLLGGAALVVRTLPEIRRYAKISSM
jgi:hypothetical protein